jgi:predicted ATPase/class 3 adenylate cyclase
MAVAQPAGTVTLVFTDIEGSTRLLEELGTDAYRDALAEHRQVVREACARHQGYEVDYEGDAFFYAFASARAAVSAVQDAMVGLEAGSVRIRVGIHTGEPALDPPKYVGMDVHRAARIMSTAHGGQVVLSPSTVALLEPESFELRDLGEHRLKDIEEAVTIYQLGDGSFPPLKTISNTNLPRPASSFLGREQELEELLAKIEQGARLVTLTGPGGTGKTRLALEAAGSIVPQYKAGVFWIGLASLRDPDLVPETIAQTLGAKDSLPAHIGEREMLLLLDNLEQVIEAAAELSELLEACPNLTLLVTSRELLRVRGEVEYPVPPLTQSEAVLLFCERSRLGPSDDIRELCARLDSLPLAVELAAARTKALSPAQIAERLSGRLDLLKGGRDADPRQQTLRATIEWSYDLLSDEEQEIFTRLSVFPGGCTLDAAEEVCEADLDTLQSLVEKSLLRFTNERYWMLETIREYAVERLDGEGEGQAARRQRSLYFADRGVEAGAGLKGADQEAWLNRLDDERDNLLASLADLDPSADAARILRLAGYGVYFFVRGLQRHLLDALDGALGHSAADSDDRLRALYVAATCAIWSGRLDHAARLAEDLLAQARRSGEREDLLRALEVGTTVAIERDRLDAAHSYVDESFVLAQELGNPVRLADVFNRVGTLAFHEGDWDAAAAACRQALTLRADLPDSHVAMALTNLAFALAMKNDARKTLDVCEETLELELRLADAVGVACVLIPIAYVTVRAAPERAGTLLRAAAELARLHGYAFDRFERSVYERVSAMVAELTAPERLNDELPSPGLESAVELGRLAIAQARPML